MAAKSYAEALKLANKAQRAQLGAFKGEFVTFLGPRGPNRAGCLSWVDGFGGMRGGPGDSRFELKLSLYSSNTVAPEGVAGFKRFAHSAIPTSCEHARRLGG